MELTPAGEADLEAVADLVNSAYRGDSSRQGWATEADAVGGQRTDAQTLSADLAVKPGAVLMLHREAGVLLGCVWLVPAKARTWYLGMLTVRPDLQARSLGRRMLHAAEVYVRLKGGTRIEMTVISIRDTLIAWYERRGYVATGETRPFPYGDAKFGIPLRDDLEFLVMEKKF